MTPETKKKLLRYGGTILSILLVGLLKTLVAHKGSSNEESSPTPAPYTIYEPLEATIVVDPETKYTKTVKTEAFTVMIFAVQYPKPDAEESLARILAGLPKGQRFEGDPVESGLPNLPYYLKAELEEKTLFLYYLTAQTKLYWLVVSVPNDIADKDIAVVDRMLQSFSPL